MKNRNGLYLSLITTALLANFLLTSCAATKISQCQKIILTTRKIADKSAENRQTQDIQKVLQVADAFEEAAKEMTSLKIQDEQLTQFQTGFAEVYQGHAETTRQFVSALQKKDITTARLMQQQVKRLGTKELELGNQMNEYCQTN